MQAKKNMIITYFIIIFVLPVMVTVLFLLCEDAGIIPRIDKETILYYVNIFSYIIIPFLCFIILNKIFVSDLKAMKNHLLKIIPLIVVLYAASILAVYTVIFFNEVETTANQMLIKKLQSRNYYFTTYMVIFAAPIAEESVFRCSMIPERKGIISFIMLFISSALFSMSHLSDFAIGEFLAYSILGLVLGLIYIRYRNLVLNILVHSGYNMIGLFIPMLLGMFNE